MRSARLTLALETGAVVLPDAGSIAVYRPRAGDDLSALPKDRLLIVQGFRPEHDAFAAQGYRVAVEGGQGHAAAIVCLPRSRDEARALLAEAAAAVEPGGPIVVDGQKTDGIEAIYRDLGERLAVSATLSKAHGKLFTFAAGPGLEDWAARLTAVEGGFRTLPGVFSADAPDRGSALLLAALPAELSGRVVDLGAGWGYLSRAVLERPHVKRLDLVEAEHAALACARLNVTDPRAFFHWADATRFRLSKAADVVVCNPPFHTTREADPALGLGFLQAAARLLQPQGVLWLVANRHLPYDRGLRALFREVEEIGGDAAFRIVRASRPEKVGVSRA
ncbi:methyltransferase [Cereibacter sphaeroides]|uniref:class I SAM-dependent methyltransferase n=1 Tax=Cereibacter sphaeroides TaxID=1063 RepID=UPI001F187595|nr:methyltransferase [Cereibacter sphaeroides]MCE6959426.1 methyltransferase [Cereibacter sphaeroides]MCE6968301.1 methyltransferase [Cereibacter sphaeroides]MCE6973803.1 methyltransferase [Cereibacter sphaeroides]